VTLHLHAIPPADGWRGGDGHAGRARGHLLALLAPRKAGWLAAAAAAAAAAAGERAPVGEPPESNKSPQGTRPLLPLPFLFLSLRRPRLRLRPSSFLCACARVPPPSINPLKRPRRGGPRRQAGQGRALTGVERGIHAARRRVRIARAGADALARSRVKVPRT
jgi:hypothetical protein